MLAFLNYFNNGVMASPPQIVDRMKTYLQPFDGDIAHEVGISVSDALAIAEWISERLQASLDRCQEMAAEMQERRLSILNDAKSKRWSAKKREEATRELQRGVFAERLVAAINVVGTISFSEMLEAFPDTGKIFWPLFSVQRGAGPQIRYPTEQSIAETRPLISLGHDRASSPMANGIYVALLLTFERAVLRSAAREKYLRARDKALEAEVLEKIRPFVSPDASIWTNAFETADSKFEHDIVIDDRGMCLVVEVKASPPTEPFRDTDKAFVRLRNAFRGDTGIQNAYEQANRILSRLRTGEMVSLYDDRGRELGKLLPDSSKLLVGICVTRDNFGALATNLTLLLEKEPTDPYPWVVNALDLSNLGDAWKHFGWGPKEFQRYLAQRILVHGTVMSDDELDYAGYFIRHGSFDATLNAKADLVQLNPHYSDVFDDVYRHLHLGGPTVSVTPSDPVQMDLRRSIEAGKAVFINPQVKPSGRKIGRNERCACGSGKKYKHCHGAHI